MELYEENYSEFVVNGKPMGSCRWHWTKWSSHITIETNRDLGGIGGQARIQLFYLPRLYLDADVVFGPPEVLNATTYVYRDARINAIRAKDRRL